MICSRCKKRPAIVFIAQDKEGSSTEGLCLICAKNMGIKPVGDIIEKMGLSEDDINDMMEQMGELMSMEGLADGENPFEGFIPGGAATFPFLKQVLPGNIPDNNKQTKDKKRINKKQKRKHIDMFSYNLTEKARIGKLDCVVGRDNEIERVVQILSRRTKNNPCLIGEPGVGKTAIAEGLALCIASGNIPSRLKNKEVHLLDMTALVAGTQFRGQFESRMRGLIEEVKAEKNIILFIDEVHSLIGSGDADGTMNAANILKPAMSRGEIQVIGATTFTEYRKYIEKDSALERRFQPVTVKEPSIKDTTKVLLGVKSYYEQFHRISISEKLIKKIVVLSERYISDRFLPDKAIDLLDESCACAALRDITRENYDSLKAEISELKANAEDIEANQTKVNYEQLAKTRCEIARLESKIESASKNAAKVEVTEEDIARVIELWTGIPSSKIQANELKKLGNLEGNLLKKIVGQNESVKAIATSIRRNRVQISPRRRPASFIFVGPTGVGKTELVKVLAAELFDTPETLIRMDMSEFMEKHAVSRLIGSPPGYIGYDESGQMTEKVRRQPYSVLLLDEIEKAHPDVMNILLQILDEGKITDSHGRLVNFENTVIIMTSNAGSDKKEGALGFTKSESQITKEKAMKALSDFLRPEFLSRIDEVIVFKNLSVEDFVAIARLMLDEYIETLSERGIDFEYTDEAAQWLAEHAIGGKSGARDLRNLIRKEVEDRITARLVETQDNLSKVTLKKGNDDSLSLDAISELDQ
ncbi:MAG: ATP-dependent Clp protease ATP-binding subunit [Oscillospiraceae bacterium]|jgi:ATP-dependent Clp protease ATP-binding subunit ClpA|nr:ATP-dependent Clp protease ATP-binding subunit [Oscillospiraceae bacterium]